MSIGSETIHNYTGPSMNPTFKAGDGLEIAPYGDKRPACGDVISLRPKNKGTSIVHRVVMVCSGGVRTRGDNNNHADPWTLTPEEISGRVVSVKRGEKTLPVSGGSRGRIYGIFIRRYNRLIKKISSALHPIYRHLSCSGVLRVFLPLLNTRFVSFKRPVGVEYQLIMGKRIIARRSPGAGEWRIMRPFRLLIDEEDLNRGIYDGDNR